MNCDLSKIVDQIDHVCQLAGNSLHAGIGSDMDGAFGKEQNPSDQESIGDLQKIPALLSARGYRAIDIEHIMHGNWLRFPRKCWEEK